MATLQQELGRQPKTGSVESLLKDLQYASRSGQPLDRLISIASQLHRLAGARKLRYNEVYQERLGILEARVRGQEDKRDRYIFESSK